MSQVRELGITTTHWEEAVLAFRRVAEQFDSYAMEIADKRPELLRLINDQMRGFERNFLLAEGLPDRIQYRHVIVAPSMFDAYGGSAFPGVGDLIFSLEELEPSSEEYEKVVKQLRKHISDLMIIVKRAANYLIPQPTFEIKDDGKEKKEDQEEKRPIKFCRKCDLKLD